ncbi:hypothetical protein Q7P37_001310 [Cladosporium fusiforme]
MTAPEAARSWQRRRHRDMSIEWIDVESSVLAKTSADVLVIFDCCHAGLLFRPAYRGPRRSFQYVAARKADQRTKSAGPEPFTSAMIWALKSLANRSGFKVTKIVEKFMQHETFPRGKQEAVVHGSRFGSVDEDIWLAALSEEETGGTGDEFGHRRHGIGAQEAAAFKR